jgi:predicted SnoaL-like aldol condensation-catalyzing enzyme
LKTATEHNKKLVLEAFDTLFNKRDYETAKRYWSPSYIQHSAHIEPGAMDCSISYAAFLQH